MRAVPSRVKCWLTDGQRREALGGDPRSWLRDARRQPDRGWRTFPCLGWGRALTLPQLHPLNQQRDIADYCARYGIFVEACAPLMRTQCNFSTILQLARRVSRPASLARMSQIRVTRARPPLVRQDASTDPCTLVLTARVILVHLLLKDAVDERL